jgi:hypothetical protein
MRHAALPGIESRSPGTFSSASYVHPNEVGNLNVRLYVFDQSYGCACRSMVYSMNMAPSKCAFLSVGLGLFMAACSGSGGRSSVPDQPLEQASDGTPVLVLGGPTPNVTPPNQPTMIAGEAPEVAAVETPAPDRASTVPDLVVLVRDPRMSRWSPRPTSLLVSEIQNLESLLASTGRTMADRPKIMRRLAEGYIELKFAAIRDKEAIQSQPRSANTRSVADEIRRLDAITAAARKQALKYYQMMVNDHPDFCQTTYPTDPAQNRGCNDEVLYFLGLELEADAPHEMRKHYLQLLKDFPQSKWLPHAYMAFGEFFIAEAQQDPTKWEYALKAYDKVLQFPAPANETEGVAHYRLAYIHLQKQDTRAALLQYVKAIEFSIKYAPFRSSGALGDAARREIVPVYAATGTARRAEIFFKPLTTDPPGTYDQLTAMLDALVNTYMSQAKRVEAADVCHGIAATASALPSCKGVTPFF